jgi:hypothetical protein
MAPSCARRSSWASAAGQVKERQVKKMPHLCFLGGKKGRNSALIAPSDENEMRASDR